MICLLAITQDVPPPPPPPPPPPVEEPAERPPEDLPAEPNEAQVGIWSQRGVQVQDGLEIFYSVNIVSISCQYRVKMFKYCFQ